MGPLIAVNALFAYLHNWAVPLVLARKKYNAVPTAVRSKKLRFCANVLVLLGLLLTGVELPVPLLYVHSVCTSPL